MAEAEVTTGIVKRVIEIEEQVVTLTISQDEAEALYALTGRCLAGGPTTGVFRALSNICTGYSRDVYRVTDAETGVDSPTIELVKVAKTEPLF